MMEKSFSENPDEVPTTTLMVQDIPVQVVQATIEDVIERQLVYIRGRRAIITCLDYPLIFWRYINVEKEIEIAQKIKTASESESPEMLTSSLTDSLSHEQRLLSASYFCFSLSCDDMMTLLSENEYHRSYSVHPEIFQIDPLDRVERAPNGGSHSFSDSEEEDEDDGASSYSYSYSASRFFSGGDEEEGGLDLGAIGMDEDPFSLLATEKPVEPEGSGLRRTHTVVVTPDMMKNNKVKNGRPAAPTGARTGASLDDLASLDADSDSDEEEVDAAFDAIALPSLQKTSSNPPSVLLSHSERAAIEAWHAGSPTSPTHAQMAAAAETAAAAHVDVDAAFDAIFDEAPVVAAAAPAVAPVSPVAAPVDVDVAFDAIFDDAPAVVSVPPAVAAAAAPVPVDVDVAFDAIFDDAPTVVAAPVAIPAAAPVPVDVDVAFDAIFDDTPAVGTAPVATPAAAPVDVAVAFDVNFDDLPLAVTAPAAAAAAPVPVPVDVDVAFDAIFDDAPTATIAPAPAAPIAFEETEFPVDFDDAPIITPATVTAPAPVSAVVATPTAALMAFEEADFPVDFNEAPIVAPTAVAAPAASVDADFPVDFDEIAFVAPVPAAVRASAPAVVAPTAAPFDNDFPVDFDDIVAPAIVPVAVPPKIDRAFEADLEALLGSTPPVKPVAQPQDAVDPFDVDFGAVFGDTTAK